MYKKIIITSIFVIILFTRTYQWFTAWWGCTIESGPIPEITKYIASVDIKLTALNTKNTCSKIWVVASAEKTMDLIDRAFLEIPIFDNVFLDFVYNIRLSLNGETRAPVTRDGLLFNKIEKKITASLAVATGKCNLSDEVKSGFTSLLKENHILENIYKQAALGAPAVPTGLSPDNILVADAINIGYIPTATVSCKDQNGTQDPIAKLEKAIEWIGTTNEAWLSDWKKAITMFRWWGTQADIEERTTEQRRLLQQELSRQWFSPRMAQATLNNFDCFKKEIKDDSAGEAIRARIACLKNPILGIENFTLFSLRVSVDKSKTTNQRVDNVNILLSKKTMIQNIEANYQNLKPYSSPAIDIKSALLSNLLDIHIGLVSTIEQIDKRCKAMYNNCMKAQPGITCPKC